MSMGSGMAVVRANAQYRQIVAEKERIVNAFAANVGSKHRATTKVVKKILLDGPYLFQGKFWEVKAKSLGAGVYELRTEEQK